MPRFDAQDFVNNVPFYELTEHLEILGMHSVYYWYLLTVQIFANYI